MNDSSSIFYVYTIEYSAFLIFFVFNCVFNIYGKVNGIQHPVSILCKLVVSVSLHVQCKTFIINVYSAIILLKIPTNFFFLFEMI